ncbi:hypothetical protein MSIMFI_04249 [Mycobacterium simulans]|nr:hypothetical protein MSIMFI_04249 [Mycobacterium simulans]
MRAGGFAPLGAAYPGTGALKRSTELPAGQKPATRLLFWGQ